MQFQQLSGPVPGCVEGGGQPALSCEQCLVSGFCLSLIAFADGGLGFEFCAFVVGWSYAFQSEWPLNTLLVSLRFCVLLC